MRLMKNIISPVTLALGLILLVAAPAISAGRLATAVFAGGCFWSMQHDMEHIPGVVSTDVGYTGGHVANPTYEQVSDETTGHYESIKVTYDPTKITYAQLLQKYFHTTDPTDPTGAFCDKGASYRPVIFVADAAERKAAEQARAQAQAQLKQKVVTQILPAGPFYEAEGYHQHYSDNNPERYGIYREGCGKDRRIKELWG